MSVWGRGSGCQVAGSQRGTARRGLCSSAAPAADPVPPNRIYFHHFHPRTSTLPEYSPRPACHGGTLTKSRGCGDAHTTCCVRVWCLIAWPLGRGWVCVWRGAGGRGGGGGAGSHTMRGEGETSTNTVCPQDCQEWCESQTFLTGQSLQGPPPLPPSPPPDCPDCIVPSW